MTGPRTQHKAPSVPSASRREPRPRDAVQSLERGLLVIRCFAGSGNLTLAQIAERSSLPRSTAGRIAETLVGAGDLPLEGRRYALAKSFCGWAYASAQGVGGGSVQEAGRVRFPHA
jgi:hypothetical protein